MAVHGRLKFTGNVMRKLSIVFFNSLFNTSPQSKNNHNALLIKVCLTYEQTNENILKQICRLKF